ncbi:3-deoxy-D-manno-octulosonic acid transferase [Caenimonas aquaedulcis]|uniref:3-deoxy-D-manno-octulosonic acid transferase n=1 Tax=Caenimonas aquaedulcis TaxID=2793270 RepID=A0A931H830_9BURK|nr:3-deoxy-D-manno-octulosonic acid transferase [Caenimonas aquaedulcis]MBG9390127.1 3-deoxy-D-manno-octulosonic acid transferase [Caenimonas aquaedulcis]
MIRGVYSLLAVAAQPFVRAKLKRRGVAEPGYLQAVEERFGSYEHPARPGAIWIHAVSLGETRAAAILVRELRKLEPDVRILLTHGTATGRAEGERILRDGDMQAWLPWDTVHAVRKFLNHFQPRIGVLMETEVWPNLVAEAKAHGTPLVLANARMSGKSLKQTLRLAGLARPAYAALTAVWAQTDADAKRFAQAGATVKGVFGNLKFDAAPDEAQLAQGRAWRAALAKPVVMFASSREGEEGQFFGAIREMPDRKGTRWLVVPRHPQRFDEVAALAAAAGFTVSRRSAWTSGPDAADVWIGDSLGEMALYYGMSDVALLGGSFEKLGGQNLIEAAACGCPVVMGPHTFNFAEAAELAEEAGAALRVGSMAQGVARACAMAGAAGGTREASRAALDFFAAHQGAAHRTAQAIRAIAGPAIG